MEEEGSVQVRGPSVRIDDGVRADLGDAEGLVFQHGGSEHHSKQGRPDSAASGPYGFVQHGHSFDEPAWLDEVGGVEQAASQAEDGVDHVADPAADAQVQDMGVLVGEQFGEPVIVVGQGLDVFRCGRIEPDHVSGYDLGQAVGAVRVVTEHDMGLASQRPFEQRLEFLVDSLGHHGQAEGHGSFSAIVMDDEVSCGQGAPLEVRIACSGRGRLDEG